MSDYQVADAISVSHGHMSKVLKGTANLSGKRLVKFMRETQSIAPLQWLAEQMGCDVVQRSAQAEVERLREKLREAERRLLA